MSAPRPWVYLALLAGDVWRLSRLKWVAQTSMLKTLAAKHRSTVSAMARKYRAKVSTPDGPRTCYEASVQRVDRKALVGRFGEISLKRQKKAVLQDRPVVRPIARKELITRLRMGRCELCEHNDQVEVHQVRKLADLTESGQPQPPWAQHMAKKRRKTLVVCSRCHEAIHTGQPTAQFTE